MPMINEILLAFVPLFFTMDPIGILPTFAALTQGLTQEQRKRIIIQSLLTAFGLAVGFLFVGKAVFNLLGITMADFTVAGGIILFCFAMMDLLGGGKTRRGAPQDLGAVPIGTPLVVGPATLTLALMLSNTHGLPVALSAVMINLTIVAIVFIYADILMRLLGKAGSRALSKVMMLLLAAIGIMMIRKGVIEIIASFKPPV